jgi:hypothetical protein
MPATTAATTPPPKTPPILRNDIFLSSRLLFLLMTLFLYVPGLLVEIYCPRVMNRASDVPVWCGRA